MRTTPDLLIVVACSTTAIALALWSISGKLSDILSQLREISSELSKTNHSLGSIESTCDVIAYGENDTETLPP